MRRFFQLGLATHLTLVFLIGLGAYLGVLPTFIGAIPHSDWAMHALLIGGLAFFFDGAIDHRPLAFGKGSLAGAAVLALAGIEEWAQRFSHRRSSSWGDFIADAIGVVFFVWLARRISRGVNAAPSVARTA